MPELLILGTRGIPAEHGGFENFAQRLAVYLAARGWQVTVYCQVQKSSLPFEEWCKGIQLVYVSTPSNGALGTILFDLKSTLHAVKAATENSTVILTLGYNTAVFSVLYPLFGKLSIINMDGMEWQRRKWNIFQKAWLFVNERIGAVVADYLVADHPQVKNYLAGIVPERKVFTIPYSAERISHCDSQCLQTYNLTPNSYSIIIARPEPENHILEIVAAFSSRKRGHRLVVLGKYDSEQYVYHKDVLASASEEVLFLGAIYEPEIVQALRVHARLYIHGHSVGGTNPSLIEAMAAGNPVLAHDNCFNRWVAGEKAMYFSTIPQCIRCLDSLLDDQGKLEQMRSWSISRYEVMFSDNKDLKAYEKMLSQAIGHLD